MTLCVALKFEDQTVLAADRLVVGDRKEFRIKMFDAHGLTWASAGYECVDQYIRALEIPACTSSDVPLWVQRHLAPALRKVRNQFARGAEYEALLVKGRAVYQMDEEYLTVPINRHYACIGSGQDFAAGILEYAALKKVHVDLVDLASIFQAVSQLWHEVGFEHDVRIFR